MIDIQGINIEVTDALREHVEHNAEKLNKFNNNNTLGITVNLKVKSKHFFEVDVIIPSKDVVTVSSGDDMYKVIPAAFERAEKVLSKQKGKELSKRHDKIDLTDDEE